MKITNNRKPLWTVVSIIIIIIASFFISSLLPDNPEQFRFFSLIPAIFLIAYIFITKRVIEGLLLASIIGVIMVSRPSVVGNGTWILNSFSMFSDFLLETMMEENTQWLIIVCGLMGSIIALIEKSGGALAFGEWASKRAKTQKSALIWTWILGIIIFIDDYLNALTIGACMTELTDRHKTPRELLAYVVDSTAAPVCALIPISTWAVFVARILEANNWAPEGEGLIFFIKTIPYDFYAWVAVIIVPLVVLGIIPHMGIMKKAIERVQTGGPLAPPNSEKIDIKINQDMSKIGKANLLNILIPILVLVGSTIFFDIDMQQGVLFTMAFLFIFYLAQGLMTAEEFVDISIEGFKNMILPLLLMVLAFLFARVNSEIHFTEYVIQTAVSIVTPQLLPFIIFIALSLTEFITGTNWGMYVIALPIVIPIARTMGVNVALAVAAVLSAGVFGSHICFYSDATVISSAATGCDNMQHALSQLPYGLLAAGISALLFLVLGFII